jgi:hypothetical protein
LIASRLFLFGHAPFRDQGMRALLPESIDASFWGLWFFSGLQFASSPFRLTPSILGF